MATYKFSCEVQIDQQSFGGGNNDRVDESFDNWAVERIAGALEETIRAAIGLTVPFVSEGIPIQVSNFIMKKE